MAKNLPTFDVIQRDGSGHRVINQSDYLSYYAPKGYIIKNAEVREEFIIRNESRMRDLNISREAIDPDFQPEPIEPATGFGAGVGGGIGGAGGTIGDTPHDPDYPNGKDPIDPPMKQPSTGGGPLTEPLGDGGGGDASEDAES